MTQAGQFQNFVQSLWRKLIMTPRLRIAVADDEIDMRDFYEQVLKRLGHDVVAVAQDGRDLIEQCRQTSPDLIITDLRMPVMDGLQAVHEIAAERAVPAIVVTAYHNEESLGRARDEQVQAYLIKPIKSADLEPAIVLAMQRFADLQSAQQEAAALRTALEDRKLVERAKGILMTRAKMSEPDAFRRLQKMSNDKNLKLAEIARMIVTAEDAFAVA